MTWFLVFLGGGVGSLVRFGLSGLVQSTDKAFPLGTLTVNLVGCFVLGYLLSSDWSWMKVDAYRLGVTAGVLGGFTTFSTFGLESVRLYEAGHFFTALLYVTLSLLGGLTAAYLGIRLASVGT